MKKIVVLTLPDGKTLFCNDPVPEDENVIFIPYEP